MEEPTEGPNALLLCLADKMPNAHAAQLRTHYKTKRAEIRAYAQQHEDTYKRGARIDAGAETESKRTEAWQAWTQNITKLSHPLDELSWEQWDIAWQSGCGIRARRSQCW